MTKLHSSFSGRARRERSNAASAQATSAILLRLAPFLLGVPLSELQAVRQLLEHYENVALRQAPTLQRVPHDIRRVARHVRCPPEAGDGMCVHPLPAMPREQCANAKRWAFDNREVCLAGLC